jgi:hypothetical protein
MAYIFEQESPITVRMSLCSHSSLASAHGSCTSKQKLTKSHVSIRQTENALQEIEQGMQVAEGSSGNLLNYQAPCRLSYSASAMVTSLPGVCTRLDNVNACAIRILSRYKYCQTYGNLRVSHDLFHYIKLQNGL